MTGPDDAPALRLPFDSGRNGREDVVRARARAVRRRLSAAGLGRFVPDDDVMVDLICRTSPQAETPALRYVADWLLWVFPLDDLCEHVFARAEADRPADLRTAGLPPAVTSGVTEFSTDVTSRMSPGWGRRFRGDLDSYLRHAIRYAGMSDPDDLPPLDEFLVLRREEGAARPTVDLVEVAAGADLPDDFRSSAGWRRLNDACADVLTWTNDLHSFRKERHAGSRFNLVDVLIRHDRLDERDAYARAVGMTNQMARQFIDSAASLARSGDFTSLSATTRSDVLRCVRGMQYWMRGQYEWFVTTRPARYEVLPVR